MNIALLARNPNLYSHKRLIEAAREKGFQIRIIDTLKCYMGSSPKGAKVWLRGGEELDNVNVVIPRIGASITFYGAAVVRQFEMMEVYTANSSAGIVNSRDKYRCLQLLAKNGINIPITAFGHSHEDTSELIRIVGGAPLIIKLLEGTQGVGVVLAQDNRMAENVINAFKGAKANILIQEYIKEASGSDIRCFVIGDKVVASMERKAMKPGEFRANLHQGGVGEPVVLTDEEIHMAISAARVMGLGIAGVDILRSNNGSMVIEVNSSPGLKGIETVTGIDVAGSIIKFIKSQF
ncbi:MAG: 30S ribosomal protein S6--L-glutamate ligase [Sphingobacteriia bacterium]|nr:30S ribosomal protein S6--L-glutamate ligase [Sphingobacteriia bacterium]